MDAQSPLTAWSICNFKNMYNLESSAWDTIYLRYSNDHFIISKRRGYIPASEYNWTLGQVRRVPNSLIR